MHARILAFGAALTLTVLALTGCAGAGTTGTGVDLPAASASAAPGVADLPTTPAPEPADEVAPMDGRTTITYEDGIEVKVGKPARFRPSDVSAGHERGNKAVRFTVTFINNGASAFRLDEASVEAALGADGAAGSMVFDQGLDTIDGTVAPGRKRAFVLAFSAPAGDLSVVDVAVAPSWSHEAALFTGAVQ